MTKRKTKGRLTHSHTYASTRVIDLIDDIEALLADPRIHDDEALMGQLSVLVDALEDAQYMYVRLQSDGIVRDLVDRAETLLGMYM